MGAESLKMWKLILLCFPVKISKCHYCTAYPPASTSAGFSKMSKKQIDFTLFSSQNFQMSLPPHPDLWALNTWKCRKKNIDFVLESKLSNARKCRKNILVLLCFPVKIFKCHYRPPPHLWTLNARKCPLVLLCFQAKIFASCMGAEYSKNVEKTHWFLLCFPIKNFKCHYHPSPVDAECLKMKMSKKHFGFALFTVKILKCHYRPIPCKGAECSKMSKKHFGFGLFSSRNAQLS